MYTSLLPPRSRREVCLVIGALIGFAACTTPKAANENNFRAAIDLYLSGPRGLECVPAPRVPQSIGPTGRGFWYQRNAKEIDALVRAGLVTAKPIILGPEAITDRGKAAVHYDWTEAGRRITTTANEELCFCSLKVSKLLKWTEGSPSVKHVSFTYEINNPPLWIDDFANAFGKQGVVKGTNITVLTCVLQLTNVGWEATECSRPR